MARGASPSRRAARGTHGSSQSKPARRNRRDVEDEEEEDVEMDENGDASQDSHDSVDSRAYDLVRLALFHESSRAALKRDEINKKVFSVGGTRHFNAVFEKAQHILRKTFGMEMHELMTRVERDKAFAPENLVNNPAGKAPKVTSSSKTYILRSTLPPALLEAMIQPDQAIRDAAYGPNGPDENVDALPDETLVAWQRMDNVAVIGILHVVLALILANGRSIPDPQLRQQLKKLRLKPGVVIPQPAHSAHDKPMTLDSLLTTLTKSGYLDKQRSSLGGDGGPAAKGRKRAAAGDDGDGNPQDNWEWKWGTRAIAEINEMGVALMVQEFMGDRFHDRETEQAEADGPAGAAEEEGKSEARLKHEKAVMDDLVRSAGGPLMKIKQHRAREADEADQE